MAILSRLKSLYRKTGWPEKLTLVLLIAYLCLRLAAAALPLQVFTLVALIGFAFVTALRLVVAGVRKAVWRLRNRLIVAYVFIAVVPIVLMLVLAVIGSIMLTGQIAVYLSVTELERRTTAMLGPAQGLAATPPRFLGERIRSMAPYLRERYPGLELLVKDAQEWRYPETASITAPPEGWGNASGVVLKDSRLYMWAHASRGKAEAVLLAPLTGEVLGGLAPSLGQVILLPKSNRSLRAAMDDSPLALGGGGRNRVPPPASRFDIQVEWFSLIPMALWDSPSTVEYWPLTVTSRPSAVLRTLFSRKMDTSQDFLWIFLLATTSLFLVVELISLVIGLSMTRKITRAVHNLYEGTHKVTEGEFSHRIDARGGDQLAELSHSFNRMTENLERLVIVEKEKERLQAELEIAREVQNQLYPKAVPASKQLELIALCHPARMVSGDYYDYLSVPGSQIALAIGDVAGKGISAALLMATVQASLRTQIRACLETAAAAAVPGGAPIYSSLPTARLVSQLNQQLYTYTSAEKFATFYFGVYDEADGVLTYTNAGHPPPIVIRDGEALRLETNGMVVGAFPFAEYQESRIHLNEGDLLVCFTDGITEPENEYGEMFDEEGLIDVLLKNSWRKPADIITTVIASVEQWANSPEQQDDMTLLLAKRV